jgi:peptidoglycan/xylan/chitin deacetylase (PgdA/CDA1 family)
VRATFFVATSFLKDRRLYWWERIALTMSRGDRDVAYIKFPQPTRIDRKDRGARTLNDLVKSTKSLDLPKFLDEVNAAFHVPWSPEIERESADNLIMTWDDVRALSRAGMDVESHGRNHRVLQTLDDETLHDELAGARADLEAELNRPVRAIAYPVGRRISHDPRIRRALETAGYRVGLSNASGVNRLWPAPLHKTFPLDRWDIARLSTDRSMSDAMFTTQVAIPRFAYIGRHEH